MYRLQSDLEADEYLEKKEYNGSNNEIATEKCYIHDISNVNYIKR